MSRPLSPAQIRVLELGGPQHRGKGSKYPLRSPSTPPISPPRRRSSDVFSHHHIQQQHSFRRSSPGDNEVPPMAAMDNNSVSDDDSIHFVWDADVKDQSTTGSEAPALLQHTMACPHVENLSNGDGNLTTKDTAAAANPTRSADVAVSTPSADAGKRKKRRRRKSSAVKEKQTPLSGSPSESELSPAARSIEERETHRRSKKPSTRKRHGEHSRRLHTDGSTKVHSDASESLLKRPHEEKKHRRHRSRSRKSHQSASSEAQKSTRQRVSDRPSETSLEEKRRRRTRRTAGSADHSDHRRHSRHHRQQERAPSEESAADVDQTARFAIPANPYSQGREHQQDYRQRRANELRHSTGKLPSRGSREQCEPGVSSGNEHAVYTGARRIGSPVPFPPSISQGQGHGTSANTQVPRRHELHSVVTASAFSDDESDSTGDAECDSYEFRLHITKDTFAGLGCNAAEVRYDDFMRAANAAQGGDGGAALSDKELVLTLSYLEWRNWCVEDLKKDAELELGVPYKLLVVRTRHGRELDDDFPLRLLPPSFGPAEKPHSQDRTDPVFSLQLSWMEWKQPQRAPTPADAAVPEENSDAALPPSPTVAMTEHTKSVQRHIERLRRLLLQTDNFYKEEKAQRSDTPTELASRNFSHDGGVCVDPNGQVPLFAKANSRPFRELRLPSPPSAANVTANYRGSVAPTCASVTSFNGVDPRDVLSFSSRQGSTASNQFRFSSPPSTRGQQ